jgi:hypothetical protein
MIGVQMLTTLAINCGAVTGGNSCDSGLPKVTADNGSLHSVLSFIFAIIAALAVLMIVIAGLRFVTGSSSPQETTKARNTIIYALIGLLIALAAWSIVSFVLNKL